MSKTLIKLIIGASLIIAIVIMGRSVWHFSNDEETGLALAESTVVATQSPAEHQPVKISIPKINVEADVQKLGLTKSGNMAAPSNFDDVSWYKLGTVPGEIGSAVIAGHEDDAIATPAIFYNLNKLSAGDDVYVEREDGTKLHFKVEKTEIHPYNLKGEALEKIFNAKDAKRLNLITCAGEWLPEAKTNDQRLVVYTKLVN